MKSHLCLHIFSELGKVRSCPDTDIDPKFFISLAFGKCKKDFNILNIILVQDFCPLTIELLDFLSDFIIIPLVLSIGVFPAAF